MTGRTLRVRMVQPTDEDALNELFSATLNESLGEEFSKAEIEECANDYWTHHDGQICYVADADGELTGYAIVSEEPASSGPIERLYVRRAGLAEGEEREVAEALVSALCQRGVEKEVAIPVTVDAGATALEMYDRLGFVDVQVLRWWLSMPSGHGRFVGPHAEELF